MPALPRALANACPQRIGKRLRDTLQAPASSGKEPCPALTTHARLPAHSPASPLKPSCCKGSYPGILSFGRVDQLAPPCARIPPSLSCRELYEVRRSEKKRRPEHGRRAEDERRTADKTRPGKSPVSVLSVSCWCHVGVSSMSCRSPVVFPSVFRSPPARVLLASCFRVLWP